MEPPLCSVNSEPHSLFSDLETSEVRGWDAICWDSVTTNNVFDENTVTLSAEGVIFNMVNDHETIQDTQTDIDMQFILWNTIYHQTCSIKKLIKCTQFTQEEIQSALEHLEKMQFVQHNDQFGYVLSNELFCIEYMPLMIELQRRFGDFHFDLFAIYESVSASFQSATDADYSQIDYFGTEYEANSSMELMIESDSSLQSDIDEILNNLKLEAPK